MRNIWTNETFGVRIAGESITLVLVWTQHIVSQGPEMEVRYYLDPDTGQPHIYRHGISGDEVEFVLRHPGEDLPARDGARQALGPTAGGRFLRVIYVPDPDPDSVFVITAIQLAGKPLQAYRRRRGRRRRK